MSKLQTKLIDFISENIIQITEDLACDLDSTFKNLCTDLFYDQIIMQAFIQNQGFTQISASLANKRHAFWYRYLRSNGFSINFNDISDLSMDSYSTHGIIRDLIEVKGSASTTNAYGPWQGGKKYAHFEGKKLFLLSRELYDIHKVQLNSIHVVVAFVKANEFNHRIHDSKTNRTALSYKCLSENKGVIVEHKINSNQSMYL